MTDDTARGLKSGATVPVVMFRVQGAGCGVQGAGCRVQGAGDRVQGAGGRLVGQVGRVSWVGIIPCAVSA